MKYQLAFIAVCGRRTVIFALFAIVPPVFKDCQISKITSTEDLGAAVKGHKKKSLNADILNLLVWILAEVRQMIGGR